MEQPEPTGIDLQESFGRLMADLKFKHLVQQWEGEHAPVHRYLPEDPAALDAEIIKYGNAHPLPGAKPGENEAVVLLQAATGDLENIYETDLWPLGLRHEDFAFQILTVTNRLGLFRIEVAFWSPKKQKTKQGVETVTVRSQIRMSVGTFRRLLNDQGIPLPLPENEEVSS